VPEVAHPLGRDRAGRGDLGEQDGDGPVDGVRWGLVIEANRKMESRAIEAPPVATEPATATSV
jgi:hypothetical protein